MTGALLLRNFWHCIKKNVKPRDLNFRSNQFIKYIISKFVIRKSKWVDEKIIITMSVIIYRTLFYTFGTYVTKTIKKDHNVRVSLDEKT